MFTKETKATAEKVKNQLTPICETLQTLAKKCQKTNNERSKAHRVATAWQYPAQRYYAEEAGEDWEEIKATRENDPKKWHIKLEKKYNILQEAEERDNVARLNYHNYLLYFCNMLAFLLRSSNTWAQFYERKGIETLSEYIREQTGQRAYITRDGTGFDPFGSSSFYCYFNITIYGVCSISGNNWGTYSVYKEEENQGEEPSAPTVYTIANYKKLVGGLAKLERDAKELAKKHYDTARITGLIYFIGGLSTPEKSTWKMRD